MKTGLIVAAALTTVFVGFGAIGSITTASKPTSAARPTMQDACQKAVTAQEKGRYADYWVISATQLTPETARVIYGVAYLDRDTAHLLNKGNRSEDRLVATCTGTPDHPVVELVSVNAMDEPAAPSEMDLQQQVDAYYAEGQAALDQINAKVAAAQDAEQAAQENLEQLVASPRY